VRGRSIFSAFGVQVRAAESSRRCRPYSRVAPLRGDWSDGLTRSVPRTCRVCTPIAAAGRGENDQNFPKELTDRVGRLELVVDRGRGFVAVLVYCDSEADAREIDRLMGGMSPQREGWGKRVSSDLYEVVLDEVPGWRVA
jgi:hypothetical protein